MFIFEGLVYFLYLMPVDVASCLCLLQPGKIRIGSDHCIHGLTDTLFVYPIDIDLQSINRFDGDRSVGNQGTLTQRFVSPALPLHGSPRQVIAALYMTLVMQVLHPFKGDGAAAVENEVLAAVELRHLIALVSLANKCEIAPSLDLAPHMSDLGDFVTLHLICAETTLLLHIVKGVILVLRGQQVQVVAKRAGKKGAKRGQTTFSECFLNVVCPRLPS
ncbi:hypothetical protein D3C81_1373860 [compost metagenome]